MSIISFKTSSPAGDLLSILPGIRQLFRLTGKKAVIYQALDIVGVGVQGVSQPFTNSDGESIMMGKETFDMLRPLIVAQEYIEDMRVFAGEKVDYDMDEIRLRTFVNQPLGNLGRWSFYAFPEMNCDLTIPSIAYPTIEPKNDFGIITFTNRYRNNWVNYFFLKQYESKLRFAGLPRELDMFNRKWGLNIKPLQFSNFYELAGHIKNSIFFMSNQTAFFQIAEQLKSPRILELFQPMPNVVPTGGLCMDYYHQQAAELYIKNFFDNKYNTLPLG